MYMHLSHCSAAFSGIRKFQKPEHPLGEEGRGLKSGKDYKGSKSSKKSNKSEKHVQSYTYYQDMLYYDSNDTPSSSACKFMAERLRIEIARIL